MVSLARMLIILGIVLLIAGSLLYLAARLDFPFGRLSGNIRVERNNFTCVIALGASILLSIILTVAFNLIVRFLNK